MQLAEFDLEIATPLEGMWGLSMVEEMDNAGAWLLTSLATGDGTTLTGVPSVLAAIQYGDRFTPTTGSPPQFKLPSSQTAATAARATGTRPWLLSQ